MPRIPLPALALAHRGFHLTGPGPVYTMMIAAMPAPQNLFVFAQTYADIDLAASVVVKTAVASPALLPIWAVALTRT